MAYVGIIAIVLSVIVALSAASWLAPRLGIDLPGERHAPIDGLRGFAALLVFLSHAALWLYFAKTGRWSNAPLRVYSNMGHAGVIVFFMITAYLFGSKLLQARHAGADWLRLYVSRVLRLTPLYLFVVIVILAVVALASDFQRKDSWAGLGASVAHWAAFTVWDTPDINGMRETWMVIAGVTWSLRYEWAFYLLLPLMGLALRVRAPWLLVLATTLLAGQIAVSTLKLQLATPFLGGALAVWLTGFDRFKALAVHRGVSAAALAALMIVTAVSSSLFKPIPLALIAFTFTFIAGGNTLFGLLSSPAARLLGEVSYSMYLLHGIVLFVLVHWVIGLDTVAQMSPWLYWPIIVVVTPLLVGLCMLTFVLIERPGMRSVSRVTSRLRPGIPRVKLSS